MKKGMMIMTMFVALSFLVSMIAVAPAVAKQVTQTQPTTKQQTQQGPAQTPAKQGIPAGFKPTVYEKAKEKFWGLVVVQCAVNNLNPCNSTITIKKGALIVKCSYKLKTPPLNDITEADANVWGKSKSYTICASLTNTVTAKTLKEEDVTMTPGFNWAQVQLWKKGGQGSAPKEWTEMVEFTLNPTQDYNGSNIFLFQVDKNNNIAEYDGDINNVCGGSIVLTP